MAHNKFTDDRLIAINVWCRNLLLILLPISIISIGIPIYSLLKVEFLSNFELNIFDVLGSIYQTNIGLHRISWSILLTIICVLLLFSSSRRLKKQNNNKDI